MMRQCKLDSTLSLLLLSKVLLSFQTKRALNQKWLTATQNQMFDTYTFNDICKKTNWVETWRNVSLESRLDKSIHWIAAPSGAEWIGRFQADFLQVFCAPLCVANCRGWKKPLAHNQERAVLDHNNTGNSESTVEFPVASKYFTHPVCCVCVCVSGCWLLVTGMFHKRWHWQVCRADITASRLQAPSHTREDVVWAFTKPGASVEEGTELKLIFPAVF